MSRVKSGVATQLCAEEKRALFIHCYYHALNLTIGDTIKQSKACKIALDVAFEFTKLVKFSSKRNICLIKSSQNVRKRAAYSRYLYFLSNTLDCQRGLH